MADADENRANSELKKERDRYRDALRAIATRIPPQDDTRAMKQWELARIALDQRNFEDHGPAKIDRPGR